MVAGGVLWGMRWVGMKGGMNGKDVNFDAALVESANKPKRDHSGVLAEQLFDCYCRAIAKVKMDNLRGMTVQNAPFAEVRIF